MKCLYVTDRPAIGDDAFGSLLASLRGAAELRVELREKGTTDREALRWVGTARESLGPDVPLFVNRRLDVALAAGAAGVHLPADGMPLTRVRAAAPRGMRVGVSTHSPEEAHRAIEEGADVVVIGPIFETPSKAPYGDSLGTAALGALPPRRTHQAEVFAIGGVDESRLEMLRAFDDRISGVAGIRIVQEARYPRELVERIAGL